MHSSLFLNDFVYFLSRIGRRFFQRDSQWCCNDAARLETSSVRILFFWFIFRLIIIFPCSRELNEAPLLTHAMKDKFRRSNSYSQTIMRIIFPDRWVLQGVFNIGESGKERWRGLWQTEREWKFYFAYFLPSIVRMLVLFVREHLADPKVKFHLCEF